MTFEASTALLVMIGIFVGMGTLGSLTGVILRRSSLSRTAARLALVGGSVCGFALAAILFNDQAKSTSVQIILWRLFSFREPQPLAFEFGLEANWFKTAIMGLVGGLFYLSELFVAPPKYAPISDNVRLARSVLYFAITSFLLSPNLAQSLLSWGVAALLIHLLFRSWPVSSKSSTTEGLGKSNQSRPSSNPASAVANPDTRAAISVSADTSLMAFESRRLLILFRVLFQISNIFEQAWLAMISSFPNWLGEQSEIISRQSESIILLATVSGMFAVLLTWLTLTVG